MNRIPLLFNPKNPWNWGLPELAVAALAVFTIALLCRASGLI